jgi:AraC family transcriptional regulator of adaptative response / DNA-3-methyladenine glycosylase II
MIEDFEHHYRAVRSRDSRFDGRFFVGVTSTGIYCRPSCPAVTPKRANVRFYPSAAAAQSGGFRACKRCRPDATPGSPEWNSRADLAGRAMRLIADGVVDREGVAGLARRLGYTERHLYRMLVAEVGAGPIALARARRAHTARLLIETTSLPITEVAFAAGFASIRQFNDTLRAVFAATPTQMRRARARRNEAAPGSIALRLPYRAPFDGDGLFGFLGERAVSGVEELVGGVYRRTLRLPHGAAIVELSLSDDHIRCGLRLEDLRDLGAAVQRCRRLLDLDADPVAIADVLGDDPLLGALVRSTPGRRVPGSVDGAELAVRAVLGQQVSVAGARTLAGGLVVSCGQPLSESLAEVGGLTHLFPEPAAIADADLAALAVPAARRGALSILARALAGDEIVLDPGADREEAERQLVALHGIGAWTASYVARRALGDPDEFLPTDLGVRRALARLGRPGDPASVAALAERWRPWRAYAVQHLWAAQDHMPMTKKPAMRTMRKEVVV